MKDLWITVETKEKIPVRWHVQLTLPTEKPIGAPVVLLHGFSESHETWDEIALPHHPVIALDLVGHGLSEKPTSFTPYVLHSVLHQIHEVCQCVCGLIVRAFMRGLLVEDEWDYEDTPPYRFHMWGYSLGGRLALAYALRYGSHVLSLGLESAGLGIANSALKKERWEKDAMLAHKIRERGTTWFAETWAQLPIFHTQLTYPDANKRQVLQERRVKNDAEALALTLTGTGQGSYPWMGNQLHRLKMPVCYVRGALDDPKFARFQGLIEAAQPTAECHVVQDVGHNVHWEKPETVEKIIRTFLQKVEGLPYNIR